MYVDFDCCNQVDMDLNTMLENLQNFSQVPTSIPIRSYQGGGQSIENSVSTEDKTTEVRSSSSFSSQGSQLSEENMLHHSLSHGFSSEITINQATFSSDTEIH